jgi:hypothetical protein
MVPGNSGQFILTIEYLFEQKIIYFICEGKISAIDIAEQYLMCKNRRKNSPPDGVMLSVSR